MTQQERMMKLAQERIVCIGQGSIRQWGKSFTAGFKMAVKFTLENLWISVDESLPERNRNVLALNLNGDVLVAFHDGMETWWWCDGFICGEKANGDKKYSSCCEIELITHWMPIPELKKGGEKCIH